VDVRINAGLTDPDDLPSGAQPTSWSQQRSTLRTIVLTFDQPMAPITAADLVLTNLGVDAPNDADVAVPLSDGQLVQAGDTLTINLPVGGPGAPADGAYELRVLATAQDPAGQPLDGDGDGTGGDPFVMRGDGDNKLYQLTADFNGDGGVSLFDLPSFQYWFGQAVPPAPPYMDLNGDAGVSLFDFPTFQSQFGRSITFDPVPQTPNAARVPAAPLPTLVGTVDTIGPASAGVARPDPLLAAAMAARTLKLRPVADRTPESATAPWSFREGSADDRPHFVHVTRWLDQPRDEG
jgi:hypothetical protein